MQAENSDAGAVGRQVTNPPQVASLPHNQTISVVIADDHPAMRQSLRTAFLATGDFEIAGEAATGREALRLAMELSPDVVILDMHMPEMDGIDAATRILDSAPSSAVVMQTLSYAAPYVLKALGAGVRGFVAKDDGMECLLRAIPVARAEGLYLSPAVLAEFQNTTASLSSPGAGRGLLSVFDREAPALLQWAAAVTFDRALARQALQQSFLAYMIARAGSDPIPDVKMWLLLSVISCLYTRNDVRPKRPAPRIAFSGRAVGAIHWLRALSHGHANHGDFTDYWRGALSPGETDRLWAHLRGCPSCHLEWCLVGFARSSAPPDTATLQDLRAELTDAIILADLADLSRAWSNRGRGARRLMASELGVLLGSAAAQEWSSAEDSSTPVDWAGEFLGSRAWKSSSALTMRETTGLAG